ncbi:PREDICTED: uncharacterized protein LOC108765506 [Trachymyrmex cornetzi]|uniref:uncharacterized protein LOC108765506 n=1 Tax=Trachymyrmex cornetzi TaxID=471704 RepID=UPI00084F569D|nr:PREDICTED: uncharacterized protein LOC108765506 [Trachymyrmex cornetzi]
MEEYILLDNIIFESSTSASSSDSDDDEELLNNNRNQRRVPKIRNYVEHVVALYTDVEFKSYFRLECNTFYFLVYLIGPKLDNIPFKGREQIDVVKQILITIYVLANQIHFVL